MKAAMRSLKDQALAISVSAQREEAAARAERERLEAELASVNKALGVRGGAVRGGRWGT